MKEESQVLRSEGMRRAREEASTDRQRGPQSRLRRTGIGVVVVALLCLRAELAEALHCGKRLVLVGDSRAEVLAKCGEPVTREHWVEYRSVAQPLAFASPLEEEVYFPVWIEEWEYNFGAQRFRQKVRFEDGRLRAIDALGYGD